MKNRTIMIVKKMDLTGTSVKHITIGADEVFTDEVYMEVTAAELKERSDKYWGNK